MNSQKHFSLAALALTAAVGAHAQSISVNFNTAGDLNNNFNLYENSAPVVIGTPTTAGSPYSESTTGGVGGSGKVAISLSGTVADSTLIYKNTSFDFSTAGISLNVSALINITAPTETGNRLIHIGFGADPTGGFNGNAGLAFMGFRLNPTAIGGTAFAPQWQTKTAAGATVNTAGGANLTLTNGNWYQVSITFANSGAGGILGSGFIQDFGTDGLTAGGITTLTPTALSSTDIASDASVWAGFRSFANDGSAGVDNFLAAVPEPGTMAPIVTGLGLLLGTIRRKKN